MNLRLMLSCALMLFVTLGGTPLAHAGDNNPRTETVPRALPYEGVLAVDGVPLNGTLAVTFRLWGAPAPVDAEVALYEETLQVPFVNGRFSVLLGQAQQGLANAIFDADALYVGITVGGTTLRGRQRIVPVPYALWAAKAADFTVENNLSVAGEVSVAGPLNALGGVRGAVNGRLTGNVTGNVTGSISGGTLSGAGLTLTGGKVSGNNVSMCVATDRCQNVTSPCGGVACPAGTWAAGATFPTVCAGEGNHNITCCTMKLVPLRADGTCP